MIVGCACADDVTGARVLSASKSKNPRNAAQFSGTSIPHGTIYSANPASSWAFARNWLRSATMAGQKRQYSDEYGSHQSSRTPPNTSSSRGYSSQTSSQPRPPKLARTSYSQTPRTQSGSSQRDPVIIIDDEDDDEDGDEDDASQEVQGASQSFGETQMRYVMYGVWDTLIVGVRHYNGYATAGEVVLPQRDPANPYDRKSWR